MEYEKTTNLLDRTSDNASIFNTEKRIKAYDQSGRIYSSNKEIWFKTSMLNSDLCDYSDAYIIVKGIINVTDPDNDAYNKLASKINAPFISCVSKIDNALIDNAENLDIVIPMYNLIDYRKNYSKTAGSFWNYDRDEPNSGAEGNINFSIKDSMSLDYKTSITRKLEGNNTEKEVEIAVSLKYLSNL